MNTFIDLAIYTHKYTEAISSVALGTDQIKYYISIKWSIMNLKVGLYILTRKDTENNCLSKKEKLQNSIHLCERFNLYERR